MNQLIKIRALSKVLGSNTDLLRDYFKFKSRIIEAIDKDPEKFLKDVVDPIIEDVPPSLKPYGDILLYMIALDIV